MLNVTAYNISFPDATSEKQRKECFDAMIKKIKKIKGDFLFIKDGSLNIWLPKSYKIGDLKNIK